MTATDTLPEDKYAHARADAEGWIQSIKDMLDAIGDAPKEQQGDKIEELQGSVLSVQVRSGWCDPGAFMRGAKDTPQAEEYEILLATGGPALRIIGRLTEHCEPQTAQLQIQDWGIIWTRHPASEDLLLRFAAHFWYGE